jgi:hypothetical protein
MNAPQGGTGQPPIEALLDGIGRQIDGDLARNDPRRVPPTAMLAASIVAQQGPTVRPDQLPWLMGFGEAFYRWRLFAEGAEYWKALYRVVERVGDPEARGRAVATAGAFQILSGELPPNAPHAQSTAAFVHKTFGPQHVLVRDVYAKLGAAPGAPPPSIAPPVSMSPQPARPS